MSKPRVPTHQQAPNHSPGYHVWRGAHYLSRARGKLRQGDIVGAGQEWGRVVRVSHAAGQTVLMLRDSAGKNYNASGLSRNPVKVAVPDGGCACGRCNPGALRGLLAPLAAAQSSAPTSTPLQALNEVRLSHGYVVDRMQRRAAALEEELQTLRRDIAALQAADGYLAGAQLDLIADSKRRA